MVPLLEEAVPNLPNARWVAMRLLDGDHRVREALLSGELGGEATPVSEPSAPEPALVALGGVA